MAEDMDLQTFVKTTLIQIISGVKDAGEEITKCGISAVINPRLAHATHSNPKDVEFDVAVTVSASDTGGGKAGLKIASLEIGGGKERRTETQAVSRIRFAVPIAMPGKAIDQYERTAPRQTHADDGF